jgi:pimeloyl-ACP methyl ester carboxylesterase
MFPGGEHVERVMSKDGTEIAYLREGRGRPLILVTGALDDGSENAPLATELAKQFSVYNYASRGRGASTNTLPYAVERELEDLNALMAAAGGSALVYGVSSGGALVLEAAASGLPIDKIAVYEVPYSVDDETPQQLREYVQSLEALLAEGRRSDALALFMQLAGSSEEEIEEARNSDLWPGLEAIAHTLAYDAAVLGDGRPPAARLATIRQPTLVATGGSVPFFEQAADAVVASLRQAARLTLHGQAHEVDPEVIAPELVRFFAE